MSVDTGLLDDPRWPYTLYWWYRKRREVVRLLNGVFARSDVHSTRKNRRFVELGCGAGRDISSILRIFSSQISEWRFTAVDGDPAMQQELSINLEREGLETSAIDFTTADFTKRLPFDDSSIDVVYSSEVIEHLRQPEEFLQEIFRILSSGGFLLLTTPNQPAPFELGYYTSSSIAVTPNSESGQFLGHVSVSTISSWRSKLSLIGFEQQRVRRGALRYDLPKWMKLPLGVGLYFSLEGLLDLLPSAFTHRLGSQYIALLRKP